MIGVAFLTAFGVLACGLEGNCKEAENFKALVPTKEQIEKVKRDFEHLKDRKVDFDAQRLLPSEEKIKEVKEKYEHLTDYDEELIESFKDAMLTNIKLRRVWELFFKKPLPQEAELKSSRSRVVFYLFSRSVPKTTVENVFSQAKKLKDYEFYGVIRGIDKEVLGYITSIKSFSGITVKVNPLIFERVGAEVVPAFVFAECKKTMGILRTKDCDFKAVLYGDVSLKWALERYEGKSR